MRRLLAALILAAGATMFAPSEAAASEAPPASRVADAQADPGPLASPRENPGDWIVAAGLVCYVILPLLAVIAAGAIVYRTFVRESAGSLVLPVHRTAWVARGATARAPPGIALLRF